MTSFPSTVSVMSAPRTEVEANVLRPTKAKFSTPHWTEEIEARTELVVWGVLLWVDAATFPSSPVEVNRDTGETMRSMERKESKALTPLAVGRED